MQTVRQISLSGHPAVFRLTETGFNALERYLEHARLRLQTDPDHEEVLRDLEQSIAEKLAARRPSSEQIIGHDEVEAVLAAIGPVDTGSGGVPVPPAPVRGRRRLYRIQEGQDIFGVCQGLAAYAKMDVDWVRFIFLALTTVTGGLFMLVYLGLAFYLPVVPTRAEYAAAQGALSHVP